LSQVAFRRIRSRVIVDNPVASVQTGVATVRITGLHGLLQVGVALAYFPNSGKRPASFAGNTFDLYQIAENQDGAEVQLDDTSVNGGQQAPNQWDVDTTLPELELRHTYAGMGAADVGHWEVILTIVPAVEMCRALFDELADRVDIRGEAITLA